MHREEGANCGLNCSITPDLTTEYSVNIYSDEAVKRIKQVKNI